ncbi:hypothetical protein LCGC14_2661010 [marine sediment metagenome]|uniref:Uncharacterized protein n=1 Tax=marine sediment metagenome TaxID=412755 RepID=A0A0F9C237_9ZZZZ
MNEDYSQPFFVPHRMAKRLGWAHAGYLPALEQPRPIPHREHIFLEHIAALKSEIDSLKRGYHTHKKRTSKSFKYK